MNTKPATLVCAMIAGAALIAACGSVAAQTDTTGDFSQVDSFTWTTSTHAIDGKLVPGEIQTTTNYGENTFATGGQSSYTKFTNFDTANAIANRFKWTPGRSSYSTGFRTGPLSAGRLPPRRSASTPWADR